MEPICVSCERTISFYADEFREWLWREDESGEIVGVICPDCQSDEDRADIRRWLASLREVRRSRPDAPRGGFEL